MSAKQPTDRLAKTGRRTHVGIYADDALDDAVAVAQRALDAAEAQANAAWARRVNALRADDPTRPLSEIEAQADAERDAELEPFRQTLDAAYAALDAGTLWFTFRSIGRDAWYDLVAAHPATEEDDQALADMGVTAKAPFSRRTMEPHLLAAASVDPRLSLDDAKALLTSPDWNEHEIAALFNAAVTAQTQARLADDARRPR